MKSLLFLLLFFTIGIQAKVIDPGDREKLGYIILIKPEVSTYASIVYHVNKKLVIGKKYRTKKGNICIEVYPNIRSMSVKQKMCGIEVKPKETTEYGLTAYRVFWKESEDLSSSPLLVNFGRKKRLTVKYNGKRLYSEVKVGGSMFDPSSEKFYTGLAGEYIFDFGISALEPITYKQSAGMAHEIDITPKDKRAVIRYIPTEKVFPNAKPLIRAQQECAIVNRPTIIWRSSENSKISYPGVFEAPPQGNRGSATNLSIEKWKSLKADIIEDIFVFSFNEDEKPNHYEFVINNQQLMLPLSPGDDIKLPLHRIDVNDVRVERENGTIYYTKGTYQVSQFNFDEKSWEKLGFVDYNKDGKCSSTPRITDLSFATKSGLDVLSGKYKIKVRYMTAEGHKSQDFIVELE